MSLELTVRPEAEADALEAFRWYNEQVPGLGQEFLGELDRVMASIQANPQIHGKVHREMRRALVRRFPYGVFYSVTSDRIVVVAILHTARDPRMAPTRAKNAR
jgi:plasmid stabilization system protein ParE